MSATEARIRVTPEGRDGVWLPDRDDLVAWLGTSDEQIHCFIVTPIAMVGADWSRSAVIGEVEAAERVALLTGESKRGNVNHALAVIRDNELRMFDIGDVDSVMVADGTTTGGSAASESSSPDSFGVMSR